jgi:hypothetical protein
MPTYNSSSPGPGHVQSAAASSEPVESPQARELRVEAAFDSAKGFQNKVDQLIALVELEFGHGKEKAVPDEIHQANLNETSEQTRREMAQQHASLIQELEALQPDAAGNGTLREPK